MSEADHCRAPIVRAINAEPDMWWLPNRNTGLGYTSGLPDGFAGIDVPEQCESARKLFLLLASVCGAHKFDVACSSKEVVCCEFKAAYGSLFLGDIEAEQKAIDAGKKPSATGWHLTQRGWYENVAKPLGIPYYILAWVYPERNPRRVSQSKAKLFAVTPCAWEALERKVYPRKTVALTPELERVHEHKAVTLLPEWSDYLVTMPELLRRLRQYDQ